MPLNKLSSETLTISENALKIVWPIVLVGAMLGLILSWKVLSGDELGRVNLLHLLFVYLFVPVTSVVISSISLFFGSGLNLARLLSSFSFLSSNRHNLIRKIQQLKVDKYWFLIQSQIAAIAFTTVSLITFFVMLVITDINFVWRSTILNATDLLPWLEVIAAPWYFWNAAQPTLELLMTTQDSRLMVNASAIAVYANWWPFVLATQLSYSFLLRFILLLVSHWQLKKIIQNDVEQQLQTQITQQQKMPDETIHSVISVDSLPEKIPVTNWAGIPESLFPLLKKINFDADNQLYAGPTATVAQQSVAERWQGPQLVIVKAWEPPLAELEDYLQNGQGYLLPLDWLPQGAAANSAVSLKLCKIKSPHLNEWQRLINKLPHWQIYLPEQLT